MNTRFPTLLSIDEHFLSDNKGLFLIPDRSISGIDDEWIVTCANEYGKLEHTNINGFLGLSDLNYNELKISFPKDHQVLTYCENNKWMNRDPPLLKEHIYYESDGVLKPCPNVSIELSPQGTRDLSFKGTLSVDSIRMTKNCGTVVIDCSGKLEYNFGTNDLVLNIIQYTGEYITNGIPSIQKTKNGFKIINLGTNKLKGQVTVCYLKLIKNKK